jgi:hypothetical protein
MSVRNARPFRWSPVTVCDSLDATDNVKGAMSSLANLIPDPSTRNIWQCRPAAISKTSFAGFSSPGFVSCLKIVGNFAVGMLSTSRTAACDEPFVFNLVTGAFVAVTGVTSANVPTSPATTGAWVAPTIDIVGTWAIITHPGFNGANGWYGGINLSNPAVPFWQSGNLAVNPLASIPQWVAQYNGRAWFGLNPASGQPSVAFSDSLNPWTATNAGQALFFGDNIALTGGIGLPLNNVLGGIVQSLIVFKANAAYQVTGDLTTTNLAVNAIQSGIGTIFPSTIVITPKGISFLANDGIRFVNEQGHITDPIGFAGDGIVNFLVNAQVPSRVRSVCNGTVLRIAFQNALVSGNPTQEYWYDLVRGVWSGPHSISSSCASPYNGTFIISPQGIIGSLWQSDSVQSASSTFIENGTQLGWTYQTSMLPDDGGMSEKYLSETTLALASPPGSQTINVLAADENGVTYDATTIALSAGSALWGSATWGSFLWGGATVGLRPYKVSWDQPIVFRRMSVVAAGNSGLGLRVGDLFMRIADLGYLQEQS